MQTPFRMFLLAMGVTMVLAVPRALAQQAGSLSEAVKQREDSMRQMKAVTDAQKAGLYDKYANALDALLKQTTAKGDLESALIVKGEIESARSKRTVSAGTLPALDNYRATLNKSLAGIDSSASASQAQVDGAYQRSLGQLKVDLTKAGRLEEALAVDKELKNLAASTAAAATPPASTVPAVAPSPAGGPVDLEKPIVGEFTLAVGNYRPRETVVLGGPGVNKGAEPAGSLRLVAGTQFDDATLFARKGLLSADKVLFKGCTLMADHSGSIQAKESLFSECSMQKGGRWNVDYFSSKWTFENCVFTRSFFSDWRLRSIGVKVIRCTFHGVDFSPPIYVADAGSEVVADWCTILQCKFVDCDIPENFFIATRDCVFEGCRFKAAKKDAKPPIDTPIKVRAYVSDRAAVPPAPAKCAYELLDPKTAPKEIGASFAYQVGGRALKFQ